MLIDVVDHRIYPDHPSANGPVIQDDSSKMIVQSLSHRYVLHTR